MPPPRVHYRVALDDRGSHLFRVSLTLAAPAAAQVLRLPVWLPGSYLLREFARHLQDLQATQGGRPVRLEQQDKTSWLAHCSGPGALTVTWRVHALDPSVRGAWLDDERGFFNGSSLFLAADGRTHEPQRLTIARLPAGWDIATTLPAGPGRQVYDVADYAELIDHPVEMGDRTRWWRGACQAGGVPHELVVVGAWPGFDGDRLLADTARICQAQIRLWHGRGKPPFKRYLFLLRVADDGYGGLEHRASTALLANRRDLPRAGTGAQDTGYQRLLGLISHEYFHAWNVKRLVPLELAAPDLGREAYTRLLWWFEGATSYYDDLVLARTGLADLPHYLGLLAGRVNELAATPGRLLQSVAQASFDAWTRYYRPDEYTPNGTVSYYTKGSLVAACLDLTLRRAGAGSLDGVLRRLWALQRPVTEADLAAALGAEAGRPLDAELAAWVHGTAELPLAPLLADFGVQLRQEAPTLAATLGLRLNEGPVSGVTVRVVLRGSAAEAAGVLPGDELLAAGGWRLRRLEEARAWLVPGQPVELLVVRDQRLRTLQLQVPAAPAVASVVLQPDPQASAQALARRRSWLGA